MEWKEVAGGPLTKQDRQVAAAISKVLGKSLEEAEAFLLARSQISRAAIALSPKLAVELRT